MLDFLMLAYCCALRLYLFCARSRKQGRLPTSCVKAVCIPAVAASISEGDHKGRPDAVLCMVTLGLGYTLLATDHQSAICNR
jgi:hypothetical protein